MLAFNTLKKKPNYFSGANYTRREEYWPFMNTVVELRFTITIFFSEMLFRSIAFLLNFSVPRSLSINKGTDIKHHKEFKREPGLVAHPTFASKGDKGGRY